MGGHLQKPKVRDYDIQDMGSHLEARISDYDLATGVELGSQNEELKALEKSLKELELYDEVASLQEKEKEDEDSSYDTAFMQDVESLNLKIKDANNEDDYSALISRMLCWFYMRNLKLFDATELQFG